MFLKCKYKSFPLYDGRYFNLYIEEELSNKNIAGNF